MELTELEFEDLLSLAMKDNKDVPTKINDKLKKKLNTKSRYKRIIKSVPASAAACLVVGVILTSVLYNNKEIYELEGNEINQGTVINTSEETDIIVAEEIVEEKIISPQEKTVKKSVKPVENKKAVPIEDFSADTAQTEAYSGEENQNTAEETVIETYTLSREITLFDYLENNQDLINDVSQKVKEKMSTDEYIEYYEGFASISGEERYYITDKSELVIIFEPGVVAAEENGEIYINVGVVEKTNEESGE